MIKKNVINLKIVVFFLVFNLLIIPTMFAQVNTEITITIESVPSEEKLVSFNKGDELRKQFKFYDAIREYENVLAGTEKSGKESEASYNIGLCYTWIQDLEKAALQFNEVLRNYPDDSMATAFAEYGLSWVEIRQGKYQEAINRLERKLDEKTCPDYEHNAAMQFQIGRIYMKFLKDLNKADDAFQKVMINYPDSEISNHPFLDSLKN